MLKSTQPVRANFSLKAPTTTRRSTQCRAGPNPSSANPSPSPSAIPPPSRRAALTAASLLILPQLPSFADDEISTITAPSSSIYTDPQDGFSLSVPQGWAQGTGGPLGGMDPNDKRAAYSNAAGLQRVVAWVPSTPDVSLAITVRTPAADFTTLGSFGTAIQWGESLVASMDRSYLLKVPQTGKGLFGGGEPATVAKLVDVKESNGQYIVQYTVSREGSPTRVVVSAVALGASPKGLRRFYTINGSCTAETEGQYFDVLKEAVASFKVLPLNS